MFVLREAAGEIQRGERFAFGENWASFLSLVDENRILAAESSMVGLLGRPRLDGARFLDIGSGSGLFSLAAHRLGAVLLSFDSDPHSVACTKEVRRRYAQDDPSWQVERGSVLDEAYIRSLGSFDIVYCWGVLHHTGAMWEAVENAARAVAPGGLLVVAIYNRQRLWTPFWSRVKRTYLALPALLRPLLVWAYLFYAGIASAASDLKRGRAPWARWRINGHRGMNLYHDAVDWVGGWPFEVATPTEMETFLGERGFRLTKSVTVGRRHGCNEFVFQRRPGPG